MKSRVGSMVRIAGVLVGALSLAGCHAGVGPVVGYAIERGPLFGWEASGGWAIARGAVGGSYRIRAEAPPYDEDASAEEAENDEVSAAHYLVAEPGILAGATLGAGVGGEGTAFVYGAWLGAPLPIDLQAGDRFGDWEPVISVAIGWRYLAGSHEIYLTPKVNLADLPRLAH